MKVGKVSFKTRVARRIFILFMICSMLPVSIFAIISFIHVRYELIDQCDVTLQRESKSIAISFYEKLEYLRSEINFIAAYYQTNPDELNAGKLNVLTNKIGEHFQALALLNNEKIKNIHGVLEQPVQISSEEWEHLNTGKMLLSSQASAGASPDLFMCLALNPATSEHTILIGKINQAYIIGVSERKPPLTDLFITNNSDSLMFSSIQGLSSLPDAVVKYIHASPSGQFEWQYKSKEYMANYSTLFLKPNYYYKEFIIILSELKSDVLAPMDQFKLFFTFIIVFTFGLVFFLSINQIRKNMEPIEVLKEATRKISEGLFGHRVFIDSGDEFESLGNDFNEMSTRLKEGQDLLINAAKMSTMGQMAAGIMHEIKQPLTAIYMNIELALVDKSDEDERHKHLTTVLRSVERLNSILDKFQSFSSRPKEIVTNVTINNTIQQIYELMKHELHLKNINCITAMEDNLPAVLGDEQELQQVISNLLVNSIHALEDSDSENRKIVIRTYSSEENVYLSIDDNGCGIPKEFQERIFDPFFTTKPSGKGTGLGMAIIQSILHRHKAALMFESESGKGTKFTITFPRSGSAKEVL